MMAMGTVKCKRDGKNEIRADIVRCFKKSGKTGEYSLGKTLRVGTYDIELRVLKIKIGNRYDI